MMSDFLHEGSLVEFHLTHSIILKVQLENGIGLVPKMLTQHGNTS